MTDATSGAQRWAESHRGEGHHPYPAPTPENPERWECKCDADAVWTAVYRILTREQTRQKFAHLGARAKARKAGRPLPEDDPEWQKRIREAKQRVAEHEGQLRFACVGPRFDPRPVVQMGNRTRRRAAPVTDHPPSGRCGQR